MTVASLGRAAVSESLDADDTPGPHDAWWTIHSFVIQEMLQRAFDGEDPGLLYVEMIANSRIERPGDADE